MWPSLPHPPMGLLNHFFKTICCRSFLLIDSRFVLKNRIGYAMAQRLAVDGAHVVISSRNQKNVDEALAKLKSEGLSVSGMVCHAGVKEDRTRLIEKTAAEFGGFDILISNAGVNPGGVKRLLNVIEQLIL